MPAVAILDEEELDRPPHCLRCEWNLTIALKFAGRIFCEISRRNVLKDFEMNWSLE